MIRGIFAFVVSFDTASALLQSQRAKRKSGTLQELTAGLSSVHLTRLARHVRHPVRVFGANRFLPVLVEYFGLFGRGEDDEEG